MKNFLLILLIICTTTLMGQNLVPNPSFEEYHCIPPHSDKMDCVKYWFVPNSETTDYFHVNAPVDDNSPVHSSVNIPSGWFGYQPTRTGDAYIGIHIWQLFHLNRREYASVELIEP